MTGGVGDGGISVGMFGVVDTGVTGGVLVAGGTISCGRSVRPPLPPLAGVLGAAAVVKV